MTAFGKLAGGILGVKFSIRALGICSTAVMAAAVIVMLMTTSLLIIVVNNILLGLALGMAIVSLMTLCPIYFGRKNYPEIMGIAVLFLKILGAAGAPFAEFLYDTTGSYMIPFTVLSLMLVGGVLCLSLAPPPLHPSLKKGFYAA